MKYRKFWCRKSRHSSNYRIWWQRKINKILPRNTSWFTSRFRLFARTMWYTRVPRPNNNGIWKFHTRFFNRIILRWTAKSSICWIPTRCINIRIWKIRINKSNRPIGTPLFGRKSYCFIAFQFWNCYKNTKTSKNTVKIDSKLYRNCLLYTSPSPRD